MLIFKTQGIRWYYGIKEENKLQVDKKIKKKWKNEKSMKKCYQKF